MAGTRRSLCELHQKEDPALESAAPYISSVGVFCCADWCCNVRASLGVCGREESRPLRHRKFGAVFSPAPEATPRRT
jgi:hypothetical protein